MKHSDQVIVDTFRDINEGKYTNASFSDANVVMVSKELYAILQEAWEAQVKESWNS